MWKYFVTLAVLLSVGGLSMAAEECTDCYANVIEQNDYQTIKNVKIGSDPTIDTVAVGNEGLSSAIIITANATEAFGTDDMFVKAPFAKISQYMNQTIDTLGSADHIVNGELVAGGEGAKGITWNKAIQAAWVSKQGLKENNSEGVYEKEGSLINQSTTQLTYNVYDYDTREAAKVLNVDNKLAMIVDNLTEIINISAKAASETSDNASSYGSIINEVDLNVSARDP